MLVFIHINKTAGRTVRYILRSSYGTRHCDVEPWRGREQDPVFSTADLRRLRRLYPDLASIAGHQVTGSVDLHEPGTDFRYFTVLRDPLKLCASRFQYHVESRKKKGLVFEQWIQQDWLRNAQTTRIAGTPSADDALRIITAKDMFVGLTERFDESMLVFKALRATDLDLGYTPVNVARSNAMARELLSDRRTRQALADANQADLELYEHVVKQLYPALQRDYGPSLDDDVAAYRRNRARRFNTANLTASRLKQHAVYRPLLRLYRRKATGALVERWLMA
jgi:hypothetical protein